MDKTKYLERLEFFKVNDINPYDFIGIPKKDKSNLDKKILKKYYKKMLLKLHPDKTGNETDIEFKILQICYQHILDDITPVNEETVINSRKKEDTNVKYNDYTDSRSLFKTDFTNSNVRKSLFANDTLNFDNIDQIVEEHQKMSTSYSPHVTSQSNSKNLFKDEKFNLDKFNAMFESVKPKMEDQDPDKIPEFQCANSSLTAMPINTYNGLIVQDSSVDTLAQRFNFMDYNYLKKQSPVNTNNLDTNKEYSYNSKAKDPINKRTFNKKLKDLKNQKIEVDTSLNFRDAEAKMYDTKVNQMKQSMEKGKTNIMNNLSIYPQHIIEQFNNNLLEDSSTVVRDNKLILPTGIRRLNDK